MSLEKLLYPVLPKFLKLRVLKNCLNDLEVIKKMTKPVSQVSYEDFLLHLYDLTKRTPVNFIEDFSLFEGLHVGLHYDSTQLLFKDLSNAIFEPSMVIETKITKRPIGEFVDFYSNEESINGIVMYIKKVLIDLRLVRLARGEKGNINESDLKIVNELNYDYVTLITNSFMSNIILDYIEVLKIILIINIRRLS